jgi:hypothetical protein
LAADLTPQTILTNLIRIRHLGSSCRAGWASAATCALLCSLPELPIWLKWNRQVIDRVQRGSTRPSHQGAIAR